MEKKINVQVSLSSCRAKNKKKLRNKVNDFKYLSNMSGNSVEKKTINNLIIIIDECFDMWFVYVSDCSQCLSTVYRLIFQLVFSDNYIVTA